MSTSCNVSLCDAARKQGLPVEAIKGGAATMYPEYRERLKTLPVPAASN